MLLKLTKIRSYVATMKAMGVAPAAVLDQSGLTVKKLEDPALLIEAHQRHQVIRNMLRLTGNPGLGLEIGSRAQLVDFGIVAHAQMTAPTLRDAFGIWKRYSAAVGTTIPIELEERSRKDWRVIYRIDGIEGPVGRFDAEEITSMAVSLGPALMGSSWGLTECTYSYRAPHYSQRYEAVLGCPARFDRPVTSVRVKSLSLDQPLPGHDAEFHALCVRHLDQLVRQAGRSLPTTERLRSLMLSRPATPPTADEAAGYLGMSTRSMRRHLAQEHTRFAELLQQVRLSIAAGCLDDEHRPTKEVATEVGYRSVAAFRRAFKSWTGQPVGAWHAERR